MLAWGQLVAGGPRTGSVRIGIEYEVGRGVARLGARDPGRSVGTTEDGYDCGTRGGADPVSARASILALPDGYITEEPM